MRISRAVASMWLTDTDPATLESLTVLLTGEIDRHAFGTSGYPDLVGPTITLRILARVKR